MMAVVVFGLMATLAAAGLAVFDLASGAWPDPGLAICLAAAIVAKKEGDLTLALVAGLGAGLFSVGPWGGKAIAFLVAVGLISIARRSSRLDQDLSRLATAALAAFAACLVELLISDASRGFLVSLGGLLGRSVSSALLGFFFLRLFEDGRLFSRL